MSALLTPLIFAGILAGLIQYFVDYKGLQIFDSAGRDGSGSNTLEGQPTPDAWDKFVEFLKRLWTFFKKYWRLVGYTIIGICGALLTPLISELVGGDGLVGLETVKEYVSCVSTRGEAACVKYSDWYTLVLIGYGIVFGYSAVRIIRSIGSFFLGNIASQQQRRTDDAEKKLAASQKEVEDLKQKLAAAAANQPPKPQTLTEGSLLEEEKPENSGYFNETQDELDKKSYYATLDLSNHGTLGIQLRNLLTGSHKSKLTYSPSLHLYPVVDRYPDGSLRSIYSDQPFTLEQVLELDAQVDKARAEAANNLSLLGFSGAETAEHLEILESKMIYNCEHVVPQSWFGKREPMRGDLHHLFTCEEKCNGFRDNTRYVDFKEYGPAFAEGVKTACGKREAELFEPERNRGIVARAVLYFLVRYADVFKPGLGYFRDDIPMFLKWHKADPVTLYEKHRNREIHRKQGNRNPFVDFPELVEQIDFGSLLKEAEHGRLTLNVGDDELANIEISGAGLDSCAKNPTPKPWKVWRTAESLRQLVKQVDAMAPNRNRLMDGTIGDEIHQKTDSDHNPWVWDESTKKGVVTALDITHDPKHKCDCGAIARSLQKAKDARIKYIIWNGQIMSSYAIDGKDAWEWRRYGGKNAHDKHIHISVNCGKEHYDHSGNWDVIAV